MRKLDLICQSHSHSSSRGGAGPDVVIHETLGTLASKMDCHVACAPRNDGGALALYFLIPLFFAVFLHSSSYATDEIQSCPKLVQAIKIGQKDIALRERDPQTCPTLSKIAQWYGLRQGDDSMTFGDYQKFVSQKHSWPWTFQIRAKGERTLGQAPSLKAMENYLGARGPQTFAGLQIYVRALLKAGHKEKARSVLKKAWQTLDFKLEDQVSFMKSYGSHVGNTDHRARLHMYVNQKNTTKLEALLKLLKVSNPLYTTRLSLLKQEDRAEKLYKNLSQAHQMDPQVLKDYFMWLLKRDHGRALDFSKKHHTLISKHSELFGRPLLALVRDLMVDQNYQQAQQVLKKVKPMTGEFEAERVFLLGWVAGRLDHYQERTHHLTKMYPHLKTAQSLTRFAYWIGHAHGQLGQKNLEKQWLQKAAHYPRTFYGQEALKELGYGDDAILEFKNLNPSAEVLSRVKSMDTVKALILMARMELPQEVSSFYYALQNQLHTNAEREAFISIIHKEAPHAICEVGRLFSDGYSYREFYPLLDVSRPEVKPALMHAIIRKESDFNPWAISPAGARGLMQVMPFVAAKICKEQGITFQEENLCTDPKLNIRLGCRQLQKMVNYYDNDLMLAIASYNSGSKPVDTWIKNIGDPRKGQVDRLTFLEEIPYKETRDYVRRVLENFGVYKKLL